MKHLYWLALYFNTYTCYCPIYLAHANMAISRACKPQLILCHPYSCSYSEQHAHRPVAEARYSLSTPEDSRSNEQL